MGTAKKEYNSIDILKFVLSIFVLIIHSEIDKTVISPMLRIAVPLFFVISAYLFFSKVVSLADEKERRSALIHLVKRNLLLYFFWAVIQIPLVMFMRGYFHDLFPSGVFSIVKDMVLGNGFTGSWYIIASVIAVVIVYWASKAISAGWLVLITLPFYIICCFATNYWNAFGADSIAVTICNGYYELTGLYIYTSFPVALFWVSLGRFLAEIKMDIKSRTLWVVCAVAATLLAMERYLIVRHNFAMTDDCYFTLILLCPVVFLLVKRYQFTFKSSFRFREMSTLIFVIHGCCGRVVGFVLKMISGPIQNELIKVSITIALVMVVSMFFLKMRDRLKIKVLKFAC